MFASPLSEALRPKTFSEIVGQKHLLDENGFIFNILQAKKPISLLLWGPPGCGKTSLAKLYCSFFQLPHFEISPLSHGITEIRKIIDEQKASPLFQQQVIIFVDEIHRFNKAQQDFFLPYLEKGLLVLVGATTENPSFAFRPALLSRMRVLTLNPLTQDDLEKIIDKFSLESSVHIEPLAKKALIEFSGGDGRHLINLLENIKTYNLKKVELKHLTSCTQKKVSYYDKNADNHYHFISALHKSVRGSDPQSALYYLSRMLNAGEDPHFIARRLVRIAVEDVGLADPTALKQCLAAWEAYKALGSPEGELALAQAVIYLSLSPKSNKAYLAYNQAKKYAEETNAHLPPQHILNAATSLMKEQGFGKNYIYDHDAPYGFSGQDYFPKEVPRKNFYEPKDIGFEKEMKKRLNYFEKLRHHLTKNSS